MMRAGALAFSRWRRSLLSRNGARWLTAQVSSMPSFVSCRVPYIAPALLTSFIQLWIAGQHLGGQSAHRGLRREVGDECRHRRSPPGRRPDASRRNTRPGPAATDDGEVRAARGERFCRRQPNAIGGTRDQDLLVVHGTAIQGYGHARMTCSMVKDLALNQPLTHGALKRGSRRAPASRSSSSTRNHPIRPSIKTAEGDEGATSL